MTIASICNASMPWSRRWIAGAPDGLSVGFYRLDLTGGVDTHHHRQPRAQPIDLLLPRVDDDPYRHPLGDLDEVAGGVVGLQQDELRAGRRGNALHPASKASMIEGINGKTRRLPHPHRR